MSATQRRPTARRILISLLLCHLLGFLSLLFIWQILNAQVPHDLSKSIQEIATSRGFKPETHFTVTADGYILQTVRILRSKRSDSNRVRPLKTPVLLFHGFQCSGSLWLVGDDASGNSTNSLGFLLASQSYDVWLASYRGSLYSRNHTTLNPADDAFWSFSMDEMVQYDLPALVDYIRNATDSRTISFVGHSQGNFLMFALLSVQPKYGQLIKPFIALSPVVYTKDYKASLRLFEPFKDALLSHFPRDIFTNLLRRLAIPRLCTVPPLQRTLCYLLYHFITGSTAAQIDFSRLAVYLDNLFHGSSTRNMVHFLQMFSQGSPRWYDFGRYGNLKRYRQATPPRYEMSHVNCSHIALLYTQNDWFNSLADVDRLKNSLNVKLIDDYVVADPSWNHLDLVWATKTGAFVNARIMDILKRY